MEIPTEHEDPRDSPSTISDPGVGQLYPDWLHGQAPWSVSPAQFTSKQGLPGPIMATVGGSHSFPPQVWTNSEISKQPFSGQGPGFSLKRVGRQRRWQLPVYQAVGLLPLNYLCLRDTSSLLLLQAQTMRQELALLGLRGLLQKSPGTRQEVPTGIFYFPWLLREHLSALAGAVRPEQLNKLAGPSTSCCFTQSLPFSLVCSATTPLTLTRKQIKAGKLGCPTLSARLLLETWQRPVSCPSGPKAINCRLC